MSNGVVHLIDKPLMIVARSLYEYVSEEGRLPGNRLSKFAKLLRDKGGKFAEALLEAKEGTILAPRLYTLGWLLHFVKYHLFWFSKYI